MQFASIILVSVAAAVLFGIVHDQVTIRVCLEYFTIGHPPIFPTTSPTLLALCWGAFATAWIGFPLGLALAVASRSGDLPVLGVRQLLRPIGMLLAVMAVGALVAGITGAWLAHRGSVGLWEPFLTRVPASAHVGFVADGSAHLASYVIGFLGGLLLVGHVWRRRRSMAALQLAG